ncbi:hypothetical protein CHS0354_034740 [Potamilus streckersoni]|uniref:Uncharacterized protein n=1 Tax=Potamilus streckersoni TaxID=2493646 RepID=A0AAE0SJP8_9BIVA|nr:hypothetical protein CHS0354_034740 [Potamilus streckersoni]
MQCCISNILEVTHDHLIRLSFEQRIQGNKIADENAGQQYDTVWSLLKNEIIDVSKKHLSELYIKDMRLIGVYDQTNTTHETPQVDSGSFFQFSYGLRADNCCRLNEKTILHCLLLKESMETSVLSFTCTEAKNRIHEVHLVHKLHLVHKIEFGRFMCRIGVVDDFSLEVDQPIRLSLVRVMLATLSVTFDSPQDLDCTLLPTDDEVV